MLSELCQEVRNYFDRGQPKIYGEISIVNGAITNSEFINKILVGQYFRIVGSILNDGVYLFDESLKLEDETFKGAIWLMAIPRDFLKLSNDIDKWVSDNEKTLLSPYQSESFGGYSYSKGSGKNGGSITWQDAFAGRLNLYRRIRI
jgi:hypothetical protein